MIYVLTLILFLMFYINYILTNRDLSHPCVVGIGSFLFCSVVASIFAGELYDDISPDTVVYISGSLIMFSLCGLIIKDLFRKIPIIKCVNNEGDVFPKKINIKFIIIYCIISAVILGIFYVLLQELVRDYAGSNIDPSDFMEKSREANLAQNRKSLEEKAFPLWIKIYFMIADSISYVCLYRNAYNKIYFPNKKINNWIYFVPVFVSIFHSVFMGARINILNFATFYLSIYSLLCFRGFCKSESKKIVMSLFLKLAFTIGPVFIFLGMLRAGGNYDNIVAIFRYTGASIIDLNDAIDTWPDMTNSEFLQKGILSGVVYTLNLLFGGNNIYRIEAPAITFFDGTRSNIYSALGTYYVDFGYMGILIAGVVGAVTTFLYNSMLAKVNNEKIMLAYAYFSVGIYMFSISELIISRLSISMVISIILMIVINMYMNKNDLKIKKG